MWAGEAFELKLLARSDAPSASAGLATHQVDVWQVKVTWSPADALTVEAFAPSASWRSQYTSPSVLGAADGDGGVVLLVNEIADAADANTHGARLELGSLTLRAAGAAGEVSVVVTKQQMVAYSNGIVLGDADVDGPLLDARDGAGAERSLSRALDAAAPPRSSRIRRASRRSLATSRRFAASPRRRPLRAPHRGPLAQAIARCVARASVADLRRSDVAAAATLAAWYRRARRTRGRSGRIGRRDVEPRRALSAGVRGRRVGADAVRERRRASTPLGAVGAACGGATRYQSARLRALADGHDATALGRRAPRVERRVGGRVRGATAVGVAPGVAFVSLAASSVGVTITVGSAAAAPVRLVGRVFTSAGLVVAGTAADNGAVTPSPRSTRRWLGGGTGAVAGRRGRHRRGSGVAGRRRRRAPPCRRV